MKWFLTQLALFLQGLPGLQADLYTDLWPHWHVFKPVAFSGAMSDISNRPTLADINNTLCAALGVAGKTAWSEPISNITGVNAIQSLHPFMKIFAPVAFTSSYADVVGRPNLTATALALQVNRSSPFVFETATVTSVNENNVVALKQLYPSLAVFSDFAFTGRYLDLTGQYNLIASFDNCLAETASTTTTQRTTTQPTPPSTTAETYIATAKATDEG